MAIVGVRVRRVARVRLRQQQRVRAQLAGERDFVDKQSY